MPLDPQAKAFLDMMAAMQLPPIEEQEPAEVRAAFAALRPPEELYEPVDDVRDLTVPGSVTPIEVRVFRPAGAATGRLPGVIAFHGGGWVLGDLESHEPVCRALANRSGAVVVSVDYRLAPEHPFPAAVEDAWEATLWIAEHGRELGIDTTRLAVQGDSAGANLAAVVSLMARDAGAPELRGQLLVYPVTDLRMGHPSIEENADGYLLTKAAIEWFRSHYLSGTHDAVDDWRVSPLLAGDLGGVPPTMVVTAEFDPLRDEGHAFADRLADSGVRTEVRTYDGMFHGFFGMSHVVDRSTEALDESGAFLRHVLTS